MRLTDEERAMLQGAAGDARRWAIDHQMRVGRYLGAVDLYRFPSPHYGRHGIPRRHRRGVA